ncbi:uncharacterized protein CANTADRAFT_88730 [Suhomyces tanzawaensis NRRL Y-17324]|uniref:SAM domain-containing protein n=1 Tax=Suhomyces tanzawaensis NRRL Y-17324 TaxID=984487 RepID=A0A1E4SMS8_9ASCO|nr:uncharacterized protein CANTADRAFT_88730 [Suhomyces tanzawaensis NRRL Y-17324]ODV80823.1 hypothetical protein CANTADRAFT_88730 [Suhomyces tanzawaensis NRRL Y-17324]
MDNEHTWERPIMLSPPPLEQHMQKPPAQQPEQAFPLNHGHAERQMSVGYNLQHEFETLTADLDLDLRNYAARQSVDHAPGAPNGASASSGSSGSSGFSASGNSASLLAPSASKYGFSDLLGTGGSGTPLANSLLRDNALSPIQHPVPTNNLSSLLGGTNGGGFLPPLASIPNRPQSVNDFSNYFNRQQQQEQPLLLQPQQTNFYLDLLAFTNWIENLNPQDNLTMIEYLCNNLPLDILLTFKSKLQGHLATHQAKTQSFLSPYHELYGDMENLNLSAHSEPLATASSQPQLHQPKPKLKNNFVNQHLFVDQRNPRPKSADPTVNNAVRFQQQPQSLAQAQAQPQPQQLQLQQQFERARSPTSHLYEKTSFLQQAAANPNSPLHQQLHGHHYPQNQPAQPSHQAQQASQPQQGSTQQATSDESLDLSAHTALKLGALATINSRVALDSNRKYGYGPYGNGHTYQGGRPGHFEDSINRNVNSSSVPLPRTNPKSPQSKPISGLGKKEQELGGNRENLSGINSPNSASSSNSSMPADVTNIELLNNIPAWLKLLRLHKYTDYLKDIPWKQLVEMSNEELEATGVVALGARRKLLKAFDVVKKANV